MKFSALKPRYAVVGAALLLAVWLGGCTSDYRMIINKNESGALWGLTVTSTGFGSGQPIPAQFTTDGQDVSPQLAWTPGPEGVQSFAIAMEAPNGKYPKVHWLVWNIPASQLSIPEGGGGAYPQGQNYKGTIGYTGPSPDEGDPHEFFYEVYALDETLVLPPGASGEDFAKAIAGHVLSKGELLGTYNK